MPFECGRWHRVRFTNVDNNLVLDLDDGTFRTSVSYDANEPRANASAGTPSPVPQAAFGGEGARVRYRAIRVLRDLYYTEKNARSPDRPDPSGRVSLGPGWYYVLGDNSSHSTDSRDFGPVEAAEIVGRPIAVVWPLSRMRWL